MILVTGGTGLVGSHLLFELTKTENQVRATYRRQAGVELVQKLFSIYSLDPRAQFSKIEWVNCDLTDYDSVVETLHGARTVYHCAAMVSFNPRNAEALVYNNVQGTANLVDACLEEGVEAFCHISSIAALGEPNPMGLVDENSSMGKMKRHSAYARSKYFSETEVWRGIEQGLNAVILNPSVIIGPGNWAAGSGVLFPTIAKGFPFYTQGGSGYVYVMDVVKAMVGLTMNKQWGKRYVVSSENLSHRAVFAAVAGALGAKAPYIRVRLWVSLAMVPFAWMASKLLGREPQLTLETARSAHNFTRYSAQRIIEDLKMEFTPMADAIKQTAQVFRNQLL